MADMCAGNYKTLAIKTWQEFDEFNACSAGCVYRGQGNSSWTLSTGFHRCRGVLNPLYEQEMLHKFTSQIGVYSSSLPQEEDYISWFSLMQHYGAGTRLLDVTRSKYIALFFAIMGLLEGVHNECAVWVFETFASNLNFYNLLLGDEKQGSIDTRELPRALPLREYQEYGWRFANHFVVSDWEGAISGVNTSDIISKYKARMKPLLEKGGVMEIVPRVQNKRMIAQAAEYLMPITLRRSFMANLFDGYTCDKDTTKCYAPKVTKLAISKALAPAMIDKLREMNITWQTIYPDLIGLSKEANWL